VTNAAFEEARKRGLKNLGRESFEEATAWFETAAAFASTPAETALAEIHLGSVAVLQGTPSARVAALPALLLRRDSPLHVYLAAYYLTIHCAEGRRLEAAERYLKLLLSAADEIANPYYSASAYDIRSELAFGRGAFDAAYDDAVRARETIAGCAPSEEVAMARAVIAHNCGYALLGQGRYEEALAPLQQGTEAMEACGAASSAVQAHMSLAFVHFALGDARKSERHLDIVEERIVEATEWLTKYIYYLRGEIAQRCGRHAEARAQYRRLCRFYPDFANLVELLSSVSLFPLLLPERN